MLFTGNLYDLKDFMDLNETFGVHTRDRKSIVYWYPGYQPIFNFAANFGLGRKPSQPPFESKQPITGWTYDPVSHSALVKSQ